MHVGARFAAGLVLAVVLALAIGQPARALPDFAAQTGQPCSACHIGGFGPQLTPLGRAFKIGGYTQRGGDGWASYVPLSAMVLTSFNNTSAGVPADQITHHYAANSNFALDQVSAFLAGGIGEHSGGLIEFTYSNIPNASHLDNTDLRPYTTTFDVFGNELRVGTTINNNPTVQDPYNSTYAWGFPYVASGLAPTPAASPAASTTIPSAIPLMPGMTTVCILKVESTRRWARGGSHASEMISGLAVRKGVMPYVRVAYEWDWNAQAFHVGGIYMQSNVNPVTGVFETDGSMGRDHYRDFAVDAGYQYLGDGTHIVAVQGIYTHEDLNLEGTTNAFNNANGTTFGSKSSLNQVRMNVSYWYQNTYGVTLGWQNTWGPANPALYTTGSDMTNSANGSPNSNAFIIEADWVPFGKPDSWMAPWANLKLGIQYTAYTQFNGGNKNYDGFGRNASDNNTLFLFAWMAF